MAEPQRAATGVEEWAINSLEPFSPQVSDDLCRPGGSIEVVPSVRSLSNCLYVEAQGINPLERGTCGAFLKIQIACASRIPFAELAQWVKHHQNHRESPFLRISRRERVTCSLIYLLVPHRCARIRGIPPVRPPWSI